MAPQALRVAVSGYYGCGNTGDEAVLAGIVESFRLRSPDLPVEFTVLSADPADTERRHGLNAVPRMDRQALTRTFRASDLVLSGGGSLLQDTTSLRSLLYYLWVVRHAQRCGAPVMFFAQGIGPLRRPAARSLTRLVADRVRRITVRDPESAALLHKIGVRRPPVEVTADPAFALRPSPESTTDRILSEAGAEPGGDYIGLALRPWRSGADPGRLSEVAARIVKESGRRLICFPMQPPGDVALCRAVADPLGKDALVLSAQLSPFDAVGLVSRMGVLVGMRLHALIFAASTGVPLVGLAYDPKVVQLMEMAGQSDRCASLEQLSPDWAASAVRSALSGSETVCNRLEDIAGSLRERALKNVDHALLAIGRTL
jgi:polysaccharide pyruvyl transferase CsaB